MLGISFNGFTRARARGCFRKVKLVRYSPRARYRVIKESVEEQIKNDTLQMEAV